MSRQRVAPFGAPALTAAAVVTLGVLIGLAVSPFLRVVDVFGRYIPESDPAAGYITAVLWALALGAALLIAPLRARDKVPLLILWGVRVVVVLGLMLPYEWNYESLDGFGYVFWAADPPPQIGASRWGSGSALMYSLVRWHQHLPAGSYHAIKVSFAMAGLVAVYLFYRAACTALGREDHRLLFLLGLFPSILFWSSILGKDPLVLLGVAIYACGIVAWQRRRHAAYLAVAALGTVVAAGIRLWLAPILWAPVFVLMVVDARGPVQRFTLSAAGAAVLAIAVSLFRTRFLIASASDLLETTNSISQQWAAGGSAGVIEGGFTGVGSLIRFLPIGMFTALFRPVLGEVNNAFGLAAGLEDTSLLVLALLAVARSSRRDLADPLVRWALMLVLIWAAVYGFVSYQNLGTGVRFRLQIFPVLLLSLLYLARRRSRADPSATP